MRMRNKTRQAMLAVSVTMLACIIFYHVWNDAVGYRSNIDSSGRIIHVVLIVVDTDTPKAAGISVCERIETLLKSILVFYSGTLHLHLLTNTRSEKTLSTLFRSWSMARVRTSFYNVEEEQRILTWVISHHTVNGYGQLKYVIHDILPEYVDKAIFIDTDMLVLEDISILHEYLFEMDKKGIMFASAADQYSRKDLEKSFGKGASKQTVNSGVLLYNLKSMRAGAWTSLWREEGVRLMNKLSKISSPQDLFASIAISKPTTYMQLPCVYNFQMGTGSLRWNCIKNETELWTVKIPHWSGRGRKFYETAGHHGYFIPIYRCFQKMDGYRFEETNEIVKYRTLLNLRNTKRDDKAGNVTLATHVRFEEAIEVIQRLNSNWSGPISLVVCGSSWDRAQLISFLYFNSPHGAFEIHFVYQRNEECPVEYLRRTAVHAARTNTVLVADSINSFKIDNDLRKDCEKNKGNRYLLRSKEGSNVVGVSFEKAYAQRLAASSSKLKEGIDAMKLSFIEIEVESPIHLNNTKVKKWELKKPDDSFCKQHIDMRRNGHV